jgi:signal transduction histidine kinase
VLRLLGSLRGLRVQLLLWLVLPLTLALVVVAITGINVHQSSMRQMVEELDARSARLAAAHLSDGLAERAAWLQLSALNPDLPPEPISRMFFDGGLAYFNASGQMGEAVPSVEAWRDRPVAALLPRPNPEPEAPSTNLTPFSPLFVDPLSNRPSLFIHLTTPDGGMLVGTVSLEQLGLTEVVVQARNPDMPTSHPGSTPGEAIAFLVDAAGQVIYHPTPALVGQDFKTHQGVAAVIQGQTGATYQQERNGQEWAVGYAPVAGPGWGLIVQEPWEALIAPSMRFSLLAPLTVVVAALISGLAVTFGLRYVVHPLQTLDRQATRLAWGDYSAVSEPAGGVQEIEDLRRTLAGMAEQIRRYQAGMRDYIAAITMAQEEERQRLARELHDETVQALIALGQRIEMAQKALDKDPEKARQRLAELRTLANNTQDEVRRFSRALRPLYLEDLGCVPALEMLAQEVERQNSLTVSVRIEGEVRRLAPDLELTAYRIAQEGLSNIVRHAQAQNAWLTVVFTSHELTLRLQDDGRGFEPPLNPAELAHEGHFGLMGLHERALLFGGRLEVRSKPSEGTMLEIRLPLRLI